MEHRPLGHGALRVSAIGLGCMSMRLDRLEENVGAHRVPLDPGDFQRIDEAVPPGVGAGSRYPEPRMKGVYL